MTEQESEFAESLEAVGRELRERRVAAGFNLRELATAAGLSASFLSLVERGSCSLSLTSLFAVCRALGLAPGQLLHAEQRASAPQRPYVIGSPDCTGHPDVVVGERRFQVLSEALVDRQMEPLRMRVGPTRTPAPPARHEGEEFGYVLRGRLVITIDGEECDLHAGDHVHLKSRVPHTMVNPTEQTAEALWIVSGRLF